MATAAAETENVLFDGGRLRLPVDFTHCVEGYFNVCGKEIWVISAPSFNGFRVYETANTTTGLKHSTTKDGKWHAEIRVVDTVGGRADAIALLQIVANKWFDL